MIESFLLRYALIVFSVYRLSVDFATGTGPLSIYHTVREFFINKYGIGHWISEGVQCPICISFWISLASCFIFFSNYSIVYFILIWLSIGGMVSFMWRIARQYG